ncbi:rabenosyn-5-like isoform X1 [Polyodon spathula]|uniref:rabenosyn-5-like isoform X1 n=1 Tax=Polyodon spathula TaxID=7913 RepID=UPI001B7E8FCD|nr:rabenosyn-5-like isoform X1 [Polyodon spathula]XP_041130101.1 rabenosyn-5-like isoform X1 [Polyodon spathula]XP_041130103.1 rabenosyn-5-like isoform X1 [Polyodon spathula]
MASSYPPPFEEQEEVREGFLCPLCLKDLQSFYQLQSHYECEHSGEDRDVKGQLKNLVQKAKKAKDKLLKRDGEDRAESGSHECHECLYNGGVNPYMWEPQELGATRSHLDYFKKHRAARIDHYVIEVNKLIIRLEKLTSFERTNTDAAKIRAIEKSVVSWVNDQDVPFCPDCGNKFNIRNRRHHCRLCGSIMCKKCMENITLPSAYKLTSATKEGMSFLGSPSLSPSSSVQGSRRGSISSMSSVSSVLDEKDDERIRCCRHCMCMLHKREQHMDEKDYAPEIVKFYEKLRMCMEKVDQKAPDYIKMAESLNAGESTYNLSHANGLRLEVQKYYELIDALSKKILMLGMNEEPKPHPKTQQLQRMIRYTATLFVQEKLLGLMSLPTKEKYEEMKEKRKQDQERKLQLEKQALQEAQNKRTEEKPRDRLHVVASTNGEAAQMQKSSMTKVGGWLPSSGAPRNWENSDPLLQQIDNIQSFIQQAREASRVDEVNMLEENLRQLQDEYDQQQTLLAMELSKRAAEEEAVQEEQLQILHEREWEREQQKKTSLQHSRTHYSHSREVKSVQEGVYGKPTLGVGTSDSTQNKISPLSKTQSLRVFQHWPNQENMSPLPQCEREPQLGASAEQHKKPTSSLNPFEDASTPLEDDPSNPFHEEMSKSNGKKDNNPFEEEDEDSKNEVTSVGASNPFEDYGNPFSEPSQNAAKPFTEATSTNPFDMDEDAVDENIIEEELLLQQIDNIRAYIFDAKLSGRIDEVELLSENLRELQRTLQEQKQKRR